MEVLWLPSLGEAFLRVYGQQAHLPQQTSHTLGIGGDAKQGKHVHHRQHTGRGMLGVVPVHQLHDVQVLGTFALKAAVNLLILPISFFGLPQR